MSLSGTILLADDNPKDTALLEEALRSLGINSSVHATRDGREAIQYLAGLGKFANRSLFPLPALIITDLSMPCDGGLKLLQWLQEQQLFSPVPVIVLTGAATVSVLEEVYSRGAAACLLKSLDFQALCQKLDAVLQKLSGPGLKPAPLLKVPLPTLVELRN